MRLIQIFRNFPRRFFQNFRNFPRRFSNLPPPPLPPPTFHEESAAGLNGRLARLAHSNSPSELISFYSRLGPSSLGHLNLDSFNYILAAFLQNGQQMAAFKLINHLETRSDFPGFSDKNTFLI